MWRGKGTNCRWFRDFWKQGLTEGKGGAEPWCYLFVPAGTRGRTEQLSIMWLMGSDQGCLGKLKGGERCPGNPGV